MGAGYLLLEISPLYMIAIHQYFFLFAIPAGCGNGYSGIDPKNVCGRGRRNGMYAARDRDTGRLAENQMWKVEVCQEQ